MTEACAGLTVVDATQGMAGGLATMVLADGGAEAESPRHDAYRDVGSRGSRRTLVRVTVRIEGVNGRSTVATHCRRQRASV